MAAPIQQSYGTVVWCVLYAELLFWLSCWCCVNMSAVMYRTIRTLSKLSIFEAFMSLWWSWWSIPLKSHHFLLLLGGDSTSNLFPCLQGFQPFSSLLYGASYLCLFLCVHLCLPLASPELWVSRGDAVLMVSCLSLSVCLTSSLAFFLTLLLPVGKVLYNLSCENQKPGLVLCIV